MKSLMMTMIATSLTSNLSAAPCWKDNGETRQLVECGQTQELQPNTDKQPLLLPFKPEMGNSYKHPTPPWCASDNKTKLEELICSSQTLSELDIRFNQLYKSVPSDSRPRGLVQDRNEKCYREGEEETQKKLKEWYESAISLLQQHTLSSQSLQGTYSEISWCHKPNLSEPERIMCGLNGTNLGKLDSELNQRYHSLRMRNINEQKAWLRERDQALLNGNVSQVEELYQRRINELDK